MKTLLPESFNIPLFIGISLIIRVVFVDLSWQSFFAIVLSLHHLMLVFLSLGSIIPIRYLLGAFMCLQFFIGPTLAYNGLDQYQYIHYKMKIPEVEYFSYAIPAVLSFILGLHLFAGKLQGEFVDQKRIGQYVDQHKSLPYWFIGIGFISSIVSGFFISELAFVFYLLGGFKFVGLFLLIIGRKELKLASLVLVIGSIVGSSLGDGMFHDLLTWLIFTGSVFAIKYKFGNNLKLLASVVFIFWQW